MAAVIQKEISPFDKILERVSKLVGKAGHKAGDLRNFYAGLRKNLNAKDIKTFHASREAGHKEMMEVVAESSHDSGVIIKYRGNKYEFYLLAGRKAPVHMQRIHESRIYPDKRSFYDKNPDCIKKINLEELMEKSNKGETSFEEQLQLDLAVKYLSVYRNPSKFDIPVSTRNFPYYVSKVGEVYKAKDVTYGNYSKITRSRFEINPGAKPVYKSAI